MRVNGECLWNDLMALAEIGRTPGGGVDRLTLSDADRQARDLLRTWADQCGYPVTVDGVGNMFILRAGQDPSLPPVLVGSHLDTQTSGGRFDGALGVLAGLEVLRTLDRAGKHTRRSIEVVNWTNEEGARFQPPMLCSLAFAGKQTAEWVHDRRDRDGRRFADELARIGYLGTAPVGGRPVNSYLELHIEQGPKLEAAGCPVGIVIGGYPSIGMHISVHGTMAHVGPTPMQHRRNALVGAAHLAILVDEIGWRYAPEDGKATAARLNITPNQPGQISDRAALFIDFRHPDAERLAAMEREVEAAVHEAARKSLTNIRITEKWGFGGLRFDPSHIELLNGIVRRRGYASMPIFSQAGHDAYHMCTICPTAMIFCPCVGGISHNEAENILLEHTIPSVYTLLDCVVALADR